MSYGSYTWEFEGLEVWNDPSVPASEPKLVNVGFVLVCTDPGTPESGRFGPPEYYDPGEGATWEVESIQIIFDDGKPLDVTEKQLSQLFPNGDDMINNAIEAAAENGTVEAPEPDYE